MSHRWEQIYLARGICHWVCRRCDSYFIDSCSADAEEESKPNDPGSLWQDDMKNDCDTIIAKRVMDE